MSLNSKDKNKKNYELIEKDDIKIKKLTLHSSVSGYAYEQKIGSFRFFNAHIIVNQEVTSWSSIVQGLTNVGLSTNKRFEAIIDGTNDKKIFQITMSGNVQCTTVLEAGTGIFIDDISYINS